MKLSFSSEINKNVVFDSIEKFLLENNFNILTKDPERPWGGFFVIKETQADVFINFFFSSLSATDLNTTNKLSPKILVVQPGKRLSWQYHFRRAELWKVVAGRVGIIRSDTDEEAEMKTYNPESIIKLKQGERHRLIGLKTWGIVAEIWQHTDKNNPSDEDDIIRLQDDYGR